MVKDLVSVVIPTYNRAYSIVRAVESALAQDHPSLEVIVVDDGSKDDTAERMAARFGGDARVTYLRQPNGGVCVARNAGLARARGEFVAMLDSDDAWLPGKLSAQLAILRRHPELSMVWSDMAAVDPEGKILHPSFQDRMFDAHRYFPPEEVFSSEHSTHDGRRYRMGDLSRVMVVGNMMLTSTVVARAERLARAGAYDQSCHPCEDQDYYFRVCRTGPVAWLDAPTVHYTIGAADAETAPHRRTALATKYVKVVERRLERDGDVVATLPPGVARRALSDGYAWAAWAHFDEGRMAEARGYCLARLRTRPTDVSAMKWLAASFLPAPVVRALRAKRS